MDFLKNFQKEIDSIEGISTSSSPPRYWYGTGNYVLNKIISGNYHNGVPQGRITCLTGDSGSGKSFLSANLLRSAQQAGAFCLVIDSENALDDDFMSKIGIDPINNYQYISISTIAQATSTISKFLKGYKKEYGESPTAPQIFILIDSLGMLITDTELENYDKGVTKGDQGQKNKQLKAMLRTFVQDIKTLNVTMVCTSSVYKNQDLLNGLGLWIVPDGIKYACSQIVLIQKRKLKDDSKDAKVGDFSGVRMICEGYKTRFTKPFQKVEIEVPYEAGMDECSGLLQVAQQAGVVISKGAWNSVMGSDEKWYGRDIAAHSKEIIQLLENLTTSFLDTDSEIDTTENPSSKKLRDAKFLKTDSDG